MHNTNSAKKSNIKSAFAPMRAQINPELAAKLAPLAPKPEKAKEPAVEKDQPPKQEKNRPIDWDARVILSLAVLPRGDKNNGFWGFIGQGKGYYGAAVVLNTLLWPVKDAIARSDKQMVRWLFSVALLERLHQCSHAKNPELCQARAQLLAAAIPNCQGFERILWAAYLLKDDPLISKIDSLPIFGKAPEAGPHQVAEMRLIKPKE